MNSELRGIIEKTFTFDEFCIELHKADAMFEKETGQNPIKTKNVGAKVEKIN